MLDIILQVIIFMQILQLLLFFAQMMTFNDMQLTQVLFLNIRSVKELNKRF